MKLKDINFKKPNHPFVYDVIQNNQTKAGDEIECIRCQTKYERGGWDFYSLCNDCFREFDNQKMAGRFGTFLGGKKGLKWQENAVQWAKDNPVERNN